MALARPPVLKARHDRFPRAGHRGGQDVPIDHSRWQTRCKLGDGAAASTSTSSLARISQTRHGSAPASRLRCEVIGFPVRGRVATPTAFSAVHFTFEPAASPPLPCTPRHRDALSIDYRTSTTKAREGLSPPRKRNCQAYREEAAAAAAGASCCRFRSWCWRSDKRWSCLSRKPCRSPCRSPASSPSTRCRWR